MVPTLVLAPVQVPNDQQIEETEGDHCRRGRETGVVAGSILRAERLRTDEVAHGVRDEKQGGDGRLCWNVRKCVSLSTDAECSAASGVYVLFVLPETLELRSETQLMAPIVAYSHLQICYK